MSASRQALVPGYQAPPPPTGTAAGPRWPRVWCLPIGGVAGERMSQWVNVRAYSLWSDRTRPVEELRVMSVTKIPLLVQKRGIWAVLRVQGEFCPVLGADRLRRESFVLGLVSREEGRTKCVSSLPDWRPGTACEIGGEVSDQLWRGSWASSRRSWATRGHGRAALCARGRRPAREIATREPSARSDRSRSPARPRHRPRAPQPGLATAHGHRSQASPQPTGTAARPRRPCADFHVIVLVLSRLSEISHVIPLRLFQDMNSRC